MGGRVDGDAMRREGGQMEMRCGGRVGRWRCDAAGGWADGDAMQPLPVYTQFLGRFAHDTRGGGREMADGVVRCGAMRCDVVPCGAVWCGVVRCGAVWCRRCCVREDICRQCRKSGYTLPRARDASDSVSEEHERVAITFSAVNAPERHQCRHRHGSRERVECVCFV